jgi:WD40 repeat protein
LRRRWAKAQWVRVLRGGGWHFAPRHVRSAYRFKDFPTSPSIFQGFRVVKSVPDGTVGVVLPGEQQATTTTQIDRPQANHVDEPVGEVVCFREHTDMVWTAKFSPDGKTVVSASEDGTIRLWNVEGGQRCNTLGCQDGASIEVVSRAYEQALVSHSDPRRQADSDDK